MNSKTVELFQVKGFSMWPFLKSGQKILVKKSGGQDLRKGDLVLYRADGQLVCHRLLRKENINNRWVLYCRGDTSLSKSEPINEKALEGKVTAIIFADKALDLRTPLARLWALIILFVLAPVSAFLNTLYLRIRSILILKGS